ALTEAGEAAFLRLRDAAVAFDARLRAGLADTDEAQLRALLGQLAVNVGAPADQAPPWAGLASGTNAGHPPPNAHPLPLLNAGDRVAGAAGRAVSSGRSRGLITVDRAIALVERATDGELSMRSRVCCRSAWDVAATLQMTSAEPVTAWASRTPGMAARSS